MNDAQTNLVLTVKNTLRDIDSITEMLNKVKETLTRITMIDSYQHDINVLTKAYEQSPDVFSERVHLYWNQAWNFGNLFGYASSDRLSCNADGTSVGCLTQIKSRQFNGPTPQLTELILADDRIPNNCDGITHPNQLKVFREWQLKLDKELGRETIMVPNNA